jgi:2-C-methyl-D-erythritol 4-phosphate cytidylyltransferase
VGHRSPAFPDGVYAGEYLGAVEPYPLNERVGAIVVAAGRSTRAGQDKIWADLGGEPVLAHSVRTLAQADEIDELAIVVHADRAQDTRALLEALGIKASVVAGGSRRRDSVRNGLHALRGCQWAVVHDGARPFMRPDLPRLGLEAARATGAAIAAIPSRDTVKRVVAGHVHSTPPREEMWLVQTPQVFRMELLLRALDSTDEDVTDEATLLERIGISVRVFSGHAENVKITTPEDLDLARAWHALRVRGATCTSEGS